MKAWRSVTSVLVCLSAASCRAPARREAALEDGSPVQSWVLPSDEAGLGDRELQCLSLRQVYWPADGQCHSLLATGPCPSGEWLVLEEVHNKDGQRVVCKPRICNCSSSEPDLCEMEPKEDPGRCIVAKTAAKTGECKTGEQLLLNPSGLGSCGCIPHPPHTTWPQDGQCYQLYSQGPCEPGFEFVMSASRLEPFCRPSLCPPETPVLWQDGRCYPLEEQGPCDEVEVLSLDEEMFKPTCKVVKNKVKRLLDLLPGTVAVAPGPVIAELQVSNCVPDQRGRCKPHNGASTSSRGRSRNYLEWLKMFRPSEAST